MGVIGIDLGATKVAGAIFDARGKILSRLQVDLAGRAGNAVGKLIQRQLGTLRATARRRQISIAAIGLCVPGIARAKTGRVWAPNIPGWEDYPLRTEILAAVADAGIPVVVDNDRAACILGELWRGAARGCRHAIFLAVGTGIGAGILVDGQVLRGACGIAGSIGWWALSRPYHPAYSGCGDFESHASGAGLAKAAVELISQMPDYNGPLTRKRELTAFDLFAAYPTRDPVATRVLHTAVAYWGAACANLVSLFNPQKIIFGGGVFGPATQFLRAIRMEAQKWAQPVAIRQVRFVASQLGNDAALCGAGYLALRLAGDSR
ncbi:MAG: ROK family protein [Verrucomicrobiae bacterium]|nr:ROK family protein [Verrucomicrobiae bacterium]